MLAKLTAKNQITIPKKVVDQLPDVKYFDVQLKDGAVVLKPLRVYDTDLEQIRSRIKKLGLKPDCVAEAIRWARSK
jgi:bifunctional DNA-binding transcriptional regulator/antitoxin component of YhaV-PrlF toxin-antitoxin module